MWSAFGRLHIDGSLNSRAASRSSLIHRPCVQVALLWVLHCILASSCTRDLHERITLSHRSHEISFAAQTRTSTQTPQVSGLAGMDLCMSVFDRGLLIRGTWLLHIYILISSRSGEPWWTPWSPWGPPLHGWAAPAPAMSSPPIPNFLHRLQYLASPKRHAALER